MTTYEALNIIVQSSKLLIAMLTFIITLVVLIEKKK